MRLNCKFLLVFLFAFFLAVVGLQTYWPFLPPGPALRGVTNPPATPEWDWDSIKRGASFRVLEDNLSARIGFYNLWVRLDNQVNYSLFGETQRRPEGTHVVSGPDDWLYEHHYITYAVTPGTTKEAEMRRSLELMRRVQDKLAARGVPFLLVVAPSKVEVYPEKVPAVYWGGRHPAYVTTNFERARPLFAEYGINLYDGPTRFAAWKRSMPDHLFTRSGTHWSYYSAYHVLDDLRERLNPTMRHPMPEFRLRSLRSRNPLGTDEDLLALMNLLVDEPYSHPSPYPMLVPQTAVPTEKLPRILWVHDSFGWALIDLLYPANAVRPSESLYYFQNAYAIPGQHNLNRDLTKLDWESYLRDFDAVVMVWTEIAFDFNGWGFFESVDRKLP
jgi:hypothetical protein